MSWLTVFRMIKSNQGFRSPEDAKKTIINPNPSIDQLKPNEYVDRIRRIHLNDLESIPIFLVAGLLFFLTNPSLIHMQMLMYTYVITRILHFLAYLQEKNHEIRAALWTPGSLIIFYMAIYSLTTVIMSL